ncbi:MAG: hypothetical protein JWO79_2056, partial [Actinomycetia bacterium]|nr:hypothetical protein [Actinomycetes bacterium]
MDLRPLAPAIREVLGEAPDRVDRLRGGSKKGVYRLTCRDARSAILYLWHPDEDYWPGGSTGASGLAEFTRAHEHLAGIGVRTPRVHSADGSRTAIPADFALVEDLRG